MSVEPYFVCIVSKESAFGHHLEGFSDDDWKRFINDISLVCEVDVEIDEETEAGANRGSVYVDGPAFVFRIRERRPGIFTNIEELARTIRPTTPRQT